MKIKKAISTIVFTIIGLLLVNASEHALSIIKNSGIENTRHLGFVLCRLYIQGEKDWYQKLKDMWHVSKEESIANLLIKDRQLIAFIFSNEPSEDPIIDELQDGCFDFLRKKILSHEIDFAAFRANTTYCITPEEIKQLEAQDPDFDSSAESLCNDSLWPLRKHYHTLLEKKENATEIYFKLIALLARPDRLEALHQEINTIYGNEDEEDDEENEEL